MQLYLISIFCLAGHVQAQIVPALAEPPELLSLRTKYIQALTSLQQKFSQDRKASAADMVSQEIARLSPHTPTPAASSPIPSAPDAGRLIDLGPIPIEKSGRFLANADKSVTVHFVRFHDRQPFAKAKEIGLALFPNKAVTVIGPHHFRSASLTDLRDMLLPTQIPGQQQLNQAKRISIAINCLFDATKIAVSFADPLFGGSETDEATKRKAARVAYNGESKDIWLEGKMTGLHTLSFGGIGSGQTTSEPWLFCARPLDYTCEGAVYVVTEPASKK